MFKFIYEDSARKVNHELSSGHFNLEGLLEEFRSFLRGAGFEFSEQIVLEDEPEEGICTIDEIAEENEFLKARVEQLEKELQQISLGKNPITRVTVVTSEGREYETWLDDHSEFMLEFQDDGRTLKLFEIDREDREFLI